MSTILMAFSHTNQKEERILYPSIDEVLSERQGDVGVWRDEGQVLRGPVPWRRLGAISQQWAASR